MQEHFNESYLESDIYPKAIFKGEITDWDDIQLSEDSLKILKETNALLEGHFILSSGLHSAQYIQCAQLLSKPNKAHELCVSLADKIKKEVDIKTMAVGVIVDPKQAESILIENKADFIAMGRELMYNPFWSLHAAQELNADAEYKMWPDQYRWGVNRRSKIKSFDVIK